MESFYAGILFPFVSLDWMTFQENDSTLDVF